MVNEFFLPLGIDKAAFWCDILAKENVMDDIIRDFKYQLIAFLFFMLAAPFFAFVKPVDEGALQPNLYFAACSVVLATITLTIAFFEQGIHTIVKQEATKTPPPTAPKR